MTDYGYARVSTSHQDLGPQLEALRTAGIPDERIYVDKRTGSHTYRLGLDALLAVVVAGDRITVPRLDRLARNLRDTLNLIHDQTEAGVGIRSLGDPIPIDTSAPQGAMARIPLLLFALLAEMELVWNRERVAAARAVGRNAGRPASISAERLEMARGLLAESGAQRSIREVARLMGVPNSTLARALQRQG